MVECLNATVILVVVNIKFIWKGVPRSRYVSCERFPIWTGIVPVNWLLTVWFKGKEQFVRNVGQTLSTGDNTQINFEISYKVQDGIVLKDSQAD